jgi:DNA-binding MarR family transcriptional regulator
MLTPTELSRMIASPGARVNNQLERLLGAGLIKKVNAPQSRGQEVDGREQRYKLTEAGMEFATKYWEEASKADRIFLALVTVRDQEALERCHRNLAEAVEAGALADPVKLKRALIAGRLRRQRRG